MLIDFGSREALAERLADVIETRLLAATAAKGHAAMAVSGGSSPAPLYNVLSQRDVPWENVHVPLVDERWVAPDEAGSNETFVRDALIKDRAASAHLVGLYEEASRPHDVVSEVSARFGPVASPLDVVVLGLGTDGHTASWFPHCDGLDRALARDGSRLAAITATQSDVTGEHLHRMTMTLGEVASAKFVCLLITGQAKKETFERALEPGAVEDMPVRAILKQRPDLWVCWAA